MASKVNIKFVIGLAVVLVGIFTGVLYLAYTTITKSGEDYIKLGDSFAAQQDWEQASKMYERAVGHDRTNIEWLHTWLDALLKWTPQTEIEYRQAYQTDYMGILYNLAAYQPYDADAQRDFLEAMLKQYERTFAGADAWQGLLDSAEKAYKALPQGDPKTEAIRRYRGLASLRLMQFLPDRVDLREQAQEDLQAAVDVDPLDLESRLALTTWESMEWIRNRRERRPEVSQKHFDNMEKLLAQLQRDNPNDPGVAIAKLSVTVDKALQAATSPEERRTALRDLSGADEEALQVFMRAAPGSVTPEILQKLHRSLLLLEPKSVNERLLTVIDRLIASSPDDANLLHFRGLRLSELGRRSEAIEQFQKVVDLPNRPVSLDGLILSNYRIEATAQQADNSLGIWETETDEQAKAQSLVDAQRYRDALVERIQGGENSTRVMLIDAKLAYTKKNLPRAVAILSELDKMTGGNDVEVISLLANSLVLQSQPGAAKAQFDRILKLAPWNIALSIKGAQNDIQLRDTQTALDRLEKARNYQPDNAQLKAVIASIEGMSAPADASTDPVRAAIEKAVELLSKSEPAYEEAITLLRATQKEHPDDPRVADALIRVSAEAGHNADVRALVDEALARFPDAPQFQELKLRMDLLGKTTEQQLERLTQSIEESSDDPLILLMRKYNLYKQSGEEERAIGFLEEAAKINPDHPLVIDAQFVNAVMDNDLDTARSLANKAARLNIDEADGALFAARLELAKNDAPAALGTLRRAVAKLPYSSLAWRLMGQVQLQLGQTTEAVDSLKKAFEFKPKDADTAEIYARALIQLQRNGDALEVIHESRKFTTTNHKLNELWLQLEEAAGSRELAIMQRRLRFNRTPGDQSNLFSLIRLLLEEKQWDEASKLIQEARAKDDSLELAILDARWHALRSDEGIQTGRDIILARIADTKPDELTQAYLALSQYLAEFKLDDDAIEAMRQASEHQAPGTMFADKTLGSFFFSKGRYEESLEPFKRVLDAGADSPDYFIALRYIETLIRLKRWDDASEAIEQRLPKSARDSRYYLLASEIAKGRGDTLEARRFIDEAVSIAPNDPRPFLQRARFNFLDDSLHTEVLKDLSQALKLQPTLVLAYQMRSALHNRLGSTLAAITDLRSGIEAAPESDALRSALIGQLMASDRMREAQAEVKRALEKRPDDISWLIAAADVYTRSADKAKENNRKKEYDAYIKQAASYLRDSFKQDQSPEVGRRFVVALLDSDPALNDEAIKTLDAIGEEADTQPGLIILRARALVQNGERKEGKALAQKAYSAVETSYEFGLWYNQLKRFIKTRSELVTFMMDLPTNETINPIFTVYLAKLRIPESMKPDVRDDLVQQLNQVEPLLEKGSDLGELYRVLGTIHYANKNYNDAADAFAKGAELMPDDREFLNNLAFTRANHLNDAQGALKVAEHAGEIAPTDSGVLDTLGFVYFKLGRYGQAQEILTRAINNAVGAAQQAPANLHLAQVHFANKSYSQSLLYAKQVKSILEKQPGLVGEYGDDLKALMEALDKAE